MMRNRFYSAKSNEKTWRRLAALTVVACMAGAASVAWAVCDQTSSSTPYQDLWKVHGCWNDFIQWEYRAYNMKDEDWGDRGWFDACNQNMEYAKHWSTAYLITYGLADDPARSYHGTIDWRSTAEADDNNYHNRMTHMPFDSTQFFGMLDSQWNWDEDHLKTSCLLYDTSSGEGTPASLASTFMHEAWHSWGNKYGWDQGPNKGHQYPDAKNWPACTWSACDYFYWHGLGEYKFGDMWKTDGTLMPDGTIMTDGTIKKFHAVYQMELEFLCDLIDSPKPWVPASVLVEAQAVVNGRLSRVFLNGPVPSCGYTAPW